MNPADLQKPKFTDPPVTEVVLSVQFEQLSNLTTAKIGAFWKYIEDEFPNTIDHTPLTPTFEEFGIKTSALYKLQLITEPVPPRTWFTSRSSEELVQLQQNRFIFNWRKRDSGENYDEYTAVRNRFTSIYDKFERFLSDYHIEDLKPNQCEVTYVNHIGKESDFENIAKLEKLFPFWSGRYTSEVSGMPEDVSLNMRFKIYDDAGKPFARLYVHGEPRRSTESEELLFRLVFTFRGAPKEKTKADVLSFFDLGHDHIVHNFVALTTEDMQQKWGRRDA